MHRSYKAGLHNHTLRIYKEYRLPRSGRRIDFLDVPNGKIYELKPNNPRSIKIGYKQLQLYKEELMGMEGFKNINWEVILETY